MPVQKGLGFFVAIFFSLLFLCSHSSNHKQLLLLLLWFPHPVHQMDQLVASDTSSHLAKNGEADGLIGFLFSTKQFTLHLKQCHFCGKKKYRLKSDNELHQLHIHNRTRNSRIHCLMITSFIFRGHRGGCVRGVFCLKQSNLLWLWRAWRWKCCLELCPNGIIV